MVPLHPPRSLRSCFTAFQRPNPNSENAPNSAQANSGPISNFHFSNSELRVPGRVPADRVSIFTRHESRVTTHSILIGTPERLEIHVSRRKQSAGHPSNRYTSRRLNVRRFFVRRPASTLRRQASIGRNLPETAKRVETRVSCRKQTLTTCSTRDSSGRNLLPASFVDSAAVQARAGCFWRRRMLAWERAR